MKTSFFSLTYSDLNKLLSENKLSNSGATRLFNWHYKRKEQTPLTEEIALKTKELIYQNFDFSLPEIIEAHQSADTTVKFLMKLHDGKTIESVLIPFHGKYALCLSSQVGCAMKCQFCYTGTQGLKRHLKAEEIVGQFLQAWHWTTKHRPDGDKILNLVFMGQGEPLHNFDEVKKSIEILVDQHGASLGTQRITVSTAGYLPGLKRWVSEMPRVNLALSLHSTMSAKRDELIPLNKSYPLPEILELIKTIPLQRKQFITFEYLLLKDFNDGLEDAQGLVEALRDQQAIINLIPFNPFPGAKYQKPEASKVQSFLNVLEEARYPAFIRTTKGDEILAACGQLNTAQ